MKKSENMETLFWPVWDPFIQKNFFENYKRHTNKYLRLSVASMLANLQTFSLHQALNG